MKSSHQQELEIAKELRELNNSAKEFMSTYKERLHFRLKQLTGEQREKILSFTRWKDFDFYDPNLSAELYDLEPMFSILRNKIQQIENNRTSYRWSVSKG